jgi:uncharacterized protein with GYD domain
MYKERRKSMATFFMFGSYSAEALKGISAERTEKANNIIQKLGGKLKSIYALLGEKDLVIIVEFPGIEEAIKASIAINRLTGISFSTSQAVSVEEFDKIIAEI